MDIKTMTMENIILTIDADVKSSMKSANKSRLETVRSIRAAITTFEKANPGADVDLNKILRGLENQRKMSIEAFEKAGATERAMSESNELAVIKEYIDKFLPKQMSEAEIREAVSEILGRLFPDTATVAPNMILGKTMGEFTKKYKGLADLKLVHEVIKSSVTLT